MLTALLIVTTSNTITAESNSSQVKLKGIRTECENLTQSEECQLNKGLIFIKEKDIILTTETWTIAVTVGTEDYDNILKQVEALFEYLETQSNTTELHALIPTYEISRLRAKLQTTRQQVSNLKLLLPSQRPKRGLVDGIGSALKFLFGTLDDDDYQTLNSKLEQLDHTSDTLIHVQTDRLTYVKKLTTEVDNNSKAIQLIINTVKSTVEEVNNITLSIVTEIHQLQRKLDFQAKLSSLFREIELTLIEVDNRLTQLQEALDVTSTGFLSAMLIPPTKLNNILKEIVTKLPVGLSLVINTDLDLIYHYYRIAKVHAIAVRNVIRIIIDIPLQSDNSQFELYNIKSLPYYDDTVAQYLYVKSEYQYIAVSSDRQKYAVTSAVQVKKCVELPFGICPLNVPILAAAEGHSCAYAMLVGDDVNAKQLCQRTVIRTFQTPVLHEGTNGDFWVYSLPKVTRVTLQCSTTRNSIRPVKSETKWLAGTGVLQHPRNCRITSKYFTLMPRLTGKTSVTIQANSIIIPPIKTILTPSEISLFSNHRNLTPIGDQMVSIETILNQTGRADVMDIDILQRKLEEIKASPPRHSNTSYHFIVLIIAATLIISISFFICCLQHSYVRQCIMPFVTVTRARAATAARPQPEPLYEELQPIGQDEPATSPDTTRFSGHVLRVL